MRRLDVYPSFRNDLLISRTSQQLCFKRLQTKDHSSLSRILSSYIHSLHSSHSFSFSVVFFFCLVLSILLYFSHLRSIIFSFSLFHFSFPHFLFFLPLFFPVSLFFSISSITLCSLKAACICLQI